MVNQQKQPADLLVGRPVLVLIDLQRGMFLSKEVTGIGHMSGTMARVQRTRSLVDAARRNGVPIIFVQEAHRPDLVDFGRELDGVEGVHCIEGEYATEIAAEELDFRPDDYFIRKRRYSCFFGTDLEILLKGLKAETLIFTGGLTDVCVHYTFVDAHQNDYYCRVVEDCVAGSTEQAHENALAAMEYLQTGARRPCEEILAAFERLPAADAGR